MPLPKPLRQALKKETLKIKEKYKKDPVNKSKHKDFNKFAKEMYKKDAANLKSKKG